MLTVEGRKDVKIEKYVYNEALWKKLLRLSCIAERQQALLAAATTQMMSARICRKVPLPFFVLLVRVRRTNFIRSVQEELHLYNVASDVGGLRPVNIVQ